MEISKYLAHPLLAALGADRAEQLLSVGRDVHYDDGTLIFREGGPADTLYLLHAGCVVLEQPVPGRGIVRVESLCGGDILGLSWLTPSAQWTLDARSVGPVQALAVDADALRARMHDDQALGLELMTYVVQALYRRLTRVRLQRLDVYKAEV